MEWPKWTDISAWGGEGRPQPGLVSAAAVVVLVVAVTGSVLLMGSTDDAEAEVAACSHRRGLVAAVVEQSPHLDAAAWVRSFGDAAGATGLGGLEEMAAELRVALAAGPDGVDEAAGVVARLRAYCIGRSTRTAEAAERGAGPEFLGGIPGG